MSKHRFKIEITYDDHYGNYFSEDMMSHKTLYMVENNSSDYITLVDEKGEYVEMLGADGYIDCICTAILNRDCNKKVDVKCGLSDFATIKPIGYLDFPDNIKEILK